MNKKILVLAFVSAAFLSGCTADGSMGPGPSGPGWDGYPARGHDAPNLTEPGTGPGPGPGSKKYCDYLGYICYEIGEYPFETEEDCEDYGGDVVSYCEE